MLIKALFAISIMILVFLLIYGYIQWKVIPQQELNQRLRSLDTRFKKQEKQALKPDEQQESFKQRVLIPIRDSIGNAITRLAPTTWSKKLEHQLVLAGKMKQWSVGSYAIFWVACILFMLLMFVSYVKNHPDMAVVQHSMVFLLFVAGGGILPHLLLRIMIQKRQKKILQQLPDMLDLLCVSVQAGLTFDASLRRITERMHGPLIEECSRMLDDVRMGLPRRQAMKMMCQRCEVEELSLFATAIIQAERLGTSIGQTLSNQASNMRERRRQSVKAEALKAPIKMLFPMLLFIFPAIFVILLLPTLLSLMHNFNK